MLSDICVEYWFDKENEIKIGKYEVILVGSGRINPFLHRFVIRKLLKGASD